MPKVFRNHAVTICTLAITLLAFWAVPYVLSAWFTNILGPYDPWFFFEVLLGGLLSGVMYSLVALGFVLIFKASGVFNFAQGSMVLFAALTLAGLIDAGLSIWVALPLTGVAIVALAWSIEAVVLHPLVNQNIMILFMATIGLAFFIDGLTQTIWGSDIRALDLGLPSEARLYFNDRILLSDFDLTAAAIAAILVTILVVFFQKTRTGRALRAVADDHQAALSVGIPVRHVWLIVWTVAGFIALVAGILWGSKLGVQFSLTQVALKALPVLILGGLTSAGGAVIGGLIIGAGEKIAEVFIGPLLGGAIEEWFAYAIALLFLVFRPQGLFGEKIIERI